MTSKTNVYLCGPIANCTDFEARNWRQQAKGLILKVPGQLSPFHGLDPMRRDYRDVDLTPEQVKEVVEHDKHDIARSTVVLANPWKQSDGTTMEIIFAHSIHVPVVTIRPGPYMSPWLIYHSIKIVESVDEGCEYIKRMYR